MPTTPSCASPVLKIFGAPSSWRSWVHIAFEPIPGCLPGYSKTFELPLQASGAQIVERSPENVDAAALAMVACRGLQGSGQSGTPLYFDAGDDAVADVLRKISL